MTNAAFQEILAELRARKTDHQRVEAKRARTALPDELHQTLSAFANTDGGVLLLGVDEAGGAFNVTGVADPAWTQQALQSACSEMEPALRPTIDLVSEDGAQVVAATFPPVAPTQRPCHRASLGPYNGSYLRVGDGDVRMTRAEVDETLAHRSGHDDYSARPAPPAAELAVAATAIFLDRIRSTPGQDGLDDPTLLQRWRVVDDGAPTIAGALTLGDNPPAALNAARIAYRVLPGEGDPPDARFSGEHIEGTVGELLDRAMELFARDLRRFQVMRGDALRDDLEVPQEALREILSNALLHRSFTPTQETRTIAIEISPAAAVVRSPGGLHVGVDLEGLGLAGISGVRNLALVRICEQLATPSGARLVENQASGIANADRACHEAGAMPPLFVDHPAEFQAIMLRRSPSRERASELLRQHGLDPEPDMVRLTAVALELDRARDVPSVPLDSVALDARLAARTLAPRDSVDAAAVLSQLESAGVLKRRLTRYIPYWTVVAASDERTGVAPTGAPTPLPRGSRLLDLLRAIADSPEKRLSPKGIGQALGLTSTSTRSKWINEALNKTPPLIVASTDNAYDPTRTFSLIRSGTELLARHRNA